MSEKTNLPKLRTARRMAERLDLPVIEVRRILRRRGVQPLAIADRVPVFDREAENIVESEILGVTHHEN